VRKRMTGVIVAGVVLIAGAALAQTAGSSLEPASRGIVPVTGPSTVASLPESARPEVVPAVAQGGEVVPGAGVSPKGTVTRQAPRTVKAVHKPAAKKATVAKTSAAKHVAKTAGAAKGKHVAVVKHRPLAHHAAVSKPIPVTKHQVPAKNAAPTQPVLPRV
jgi:hypothetical protein